MPRGRPRKFIGPLTQKQQQKKDHAKIQKLSKIVAQPRSRLASTSSFPPSMRVKQRYFDYHASDSVTFGKMFNINSTFDPDRTGTGHQPNGRDNMAAIYNKYRVHGAKITVNFVATSAQPYMGLISAVNNATSMSTYYILNEAPGTKKKCVGFSGDACTIRLKADCAAIAGVSKLTYEADDIYAANVSGDPGEIMTFQIFMCKVDGTVLTSGAVYAEILIEYDVTYYDNNLIGLS